MNIGKNTGKILIMFIVLILFTGCVSESNISAPTTTPTKTPKMFAPGESTSDGLTRFTLNSIRYTSFNNTKYIITDITVENISPNRTRSYGILWHFKVFDSEGYTYDPEFYNEKIISKQFDGVDVLPGDKRRGEIAFKIPETAKGLKLRFMWDPKNNGDGVTFKLNN